MEEILVDLLLANPNTKKLIEVKLGLTSGLAVMDDGGISIPAQTDGRITPEDAIQLAGRVLANHEKSNQKPNPDLECIQGGAGKKDGEKKK